MTLSDCYAASKLPVANQDDLLKLRLSGQITSRDELERVGRAKRQQANNPVSEDTVPRAKIALPKKCSITVSGEGLTIQKIVELLTSALAETKKANGISVKTFCKMMADRSLTE